MFGSMPRTVHFISKDEEYDLCLAEVFQCAAFTNPLVWTFSDPLGQELLNEIFM